MISGKDMNSVYMELVSQVFIRGEKVGNTKELRNVSFTLEDPYRCLATCRKISLAYLIAEIVWYSTASRDVAFIGKFASLWNNISDDGFTNNSAYGYILKEKYGFDQIETAVEILKNDPESRRAVVNINVPNERAAVTKDEPCTIALQFMVRNEKLECTAIMRSSDLWYGIPYDVVYFTTLQKIVAKRLGIEVGPYHHFSVSLHLYDRSLENLSLTVNAEDTYFDALKCVSCSKRLEEWIRRNIDMDSNELKKALVEKAKKLDILGGYELWLSR